MSNVFINYCKKLCCSKLKLLLVLSFFSTELVLAYNDSIDLKQSIIALDKTRTNIIYELKTQQYPILTKQEKHEYNIFIDYITLQINHYCSKLIIAKENNLLKNLPCDINSNLGIETPGKELKSTEEQIDLLDEVLISSLSDFDEMLLDEENKLNNKKMSVKDANQKSELEVYIENHENSTADVKSKSKSKSKSKKQNHKNSDAKKDASEQITEHHSSGKYGRNSGNIKQSESESRRIIKGDDDIVARQLREAAEEETDPELKRKLWQEYDNYRLENN